MLYNTVNCLSSYLATRHSASDIVPLQLNACIDSILNSSERDKQHRNIHQKTTKSIVQQ